MREETNTNPCIQCGVASCSYHDPSNYCSLKKIRVEPISGASSGVSDDESKCGSYRSRG